MKSLIKTLMIALAITPVVLSAQETDGHIKLKITREINGEKVTFEGDYENEEQMRADPNYQEFIGGNDQNFMFNLDQNFDPGAGHGFFFSMPGDDEPMIFPFDSTFSFSFDGDMDMEEFQKQMEELQKLHQFPPFPQGGMNGFSWIFSDSTDDEFSAMMQAFDLGSRQIHILRKVEIKDVEGTEFGKKGTVASGEKLILPDLNFYPNPSNGRFNLRFKVPEQGELAIKIYDVEGKEVFGRFFDQFGGTYSEAVDLTDQGEGIYLLEIRLDKNRLTKKIVVN